jgi:endoglucanase
MKKIMMWFIPLMLIAVVAYATITNLAWDANTETDLAGYKLYQSTAGATGPFTYVKTIAKGTLTAATADLPDGTYWWVLTAYDTNGNESGYSNVVTRTIDTVAPAAPKNFRLVP